MTVERTIVSGSAKDGRWWSSIVLALFFTLAPLCVVAFAQVNAPPPPVQEFVKLLDDPAVRSWLEQARNMPEGSASSRGVTNTEQMVNRLSSVRAHLATIAAALPQIPAELRRASELLLQELRNQGLFAVVALISVFAALGYGSERVFWRTTKRTRVWIGHHPMATGADRLRMIAMRLGFGLMLVAVFGLGSIGAFLVFDWPPLLRQVVIAYLAAVVLFRLALVVGRVMLKQIAGWSDRKAWVERWEDVGPGGLPCLSRILPICASAFWLPTSREKAVRWLSPAAFASARPLPATGSAKPVTRGAVAPSPTAADRPGCWVPRSTRCSRRSWLRSTMPVWTRCRALVRAHWQARQPPGDVPHAPAPQAASEKRRSGRPSRIDPRSLPSARLTVSR